MKGLHRTKIDYCRLSGELIEREGYVLNLITGCKHNCEYCYARRMVEHGRLKGSPSYPYGFEPTFHPERIRKIGGKPKLIFIGDMGDVGGDWKWKANIANYPELGPNAMTREIHEFARLNPQHIILLLTKNPAWYSRGTWNGSPNVWCGFSATNNEELGERYADMSGIEPRQTWISFEPWLDKIHPDIPDDWAAWVVIGGLSGRSPHPVSEDTRRWIHGGYDGKLFVKKNAWGKNFEALDLSKPMEIQKRHEYPNEWKVK